MRSRRRGGRSAFSLFSFQDIITSVTGIMLLVTLVLAIELIARASNTPKRQTEEQVQSNTKSVEELEKEIVALQTVLNEYNSDLSDLPSLDLETLKKTIESIQNSTDRLSDDINGLHKDLANKNSQVSTKRADSQSQNSHKKQQINDLKRQIAEIQQKIDEIGDSQRIFYKSGVEGKDTWIVEITRSGLILAKIGVSQPPKHFPSVDRFLNWVDGLPPNKNAFFLTVKPGGAPNFPDCAAGLVDRGFDIGRQVVGDKQTIIDPKSGASMP